MCDVCSDLVDFDEAHWLHEWGCPGPHAPNVGCSCDRWVHPDCCPVCSGEIQ